MLTQADVVKALPVTMKSSVSQELVDTINNISTDPLFAEAYKENFISYASVMKDGRFKTQDYINAVAYVSYKLMGYSNQEAYSRTFPVRHNTLIANGTSQKDIAAYVSAYHKGKLVNLIMEQSLVPTWIVNQEVFQKAINVQAELMLNATSEKVRTDAANSLLTHLKKPEVSGLKVNLNVVDNSGMTELKNTLADLAAQQKALIQGGVSAKVIAGAKLIDGDVTDV